MTASAKLEQLKLDLALRENNTFVGSGLGGNEKEFLKLLSYQSIISSNIDGGINVIDNTVIFDTEILEKETITNLRHILSDKLAPIVNSPHANQNEIIEVEKCNAVCRLLIPAAKKRDAFIKSMNDLEEQERDEVLKIYAEQAFKATKLTLKQLAAFKEEQGLEECFDLPYRQECLKISKRYKIITAQSITRAERLLWEKIQKFPPYIQLFSLRVEFGLDRIVKYDYDEFVNCVSILNK